MNRSFFWAACIIYSVAMVAIGVRIYQKSKKGSGSDQLLDFWIAGRTFPGWRMAVSLAAGWLMLGWIGYGMSMIYTMGLSGAWMLPIPWLLLCVIVIWMVSFVRRLPAISLPEAVEKRFGRPARTLLALCSIFVFTSWTGAETFMAGTLISPFLGIPPTMAMCLLVIPVMVYTYFGGFRAVVLTDFVQFIFVATFITILAVVAVVTASNMSEGSLFATLASTPTVSFGEGTMFSLFACGWAMPVILLAAYIPGWMIEQDLLLRIQGATSLKEARKGAWIAFGLIGFFVVLLPVITAFSAIILFPPGDPGSSEIIGSDSTGIVSAIILHHFPVWAQIAMFVGILAAQMSTIDTFANIVALPLSYDIAQPVFMNHLSTAKKATLTRILAVAAILLGLIYALNADSLMDVYVLSSGVLTASIAVPAFAIFLKKANIMAVVLSSLFGFAGNILFYVYEYKMAEHSYQPQWLADTYLGYIIVGLVASLAGLTIGIIFGKPSSTAQLATVSDFPLEGVEVFNIKP
jgi:solute:Na+ symporter, SSS family